MTLRIRQIVLATRDLEHAVEHTRNALDLEVTYRDPQVAQFGLANAMFAIGNQFLEIVAPTRDESAASRHLDRLGDSAYMLILQTDDLDRDKARLVHLGVRIVWESTYPNMRAVHLHPKDLGAAIVSLDEATPPESWRWAGPGWRPDVSGRDKIVGATIAARDPNALSARWAAVLGLEVQQSNRGVWHIPLTDGALNFVAASSGTERIVGFTLRTDRHLPVTICGTTFAH